MSATNFKTENNTYRKLIGNGLSYRVPRFQRDYSWTDAEWDDVWQDILGSLAPDGEPAHYMLQASQFSLTAKLAAHDDDWTPERIAARQRHLARLATSVWRIDQLS